MKTIPLILLTALALTGVSVRAAEQSQIDHGNTLYQYWCATCHAPGGGGMMGMGLPGTSSIQLKYKGQKPAALEQWTDLSPELVKVVVRKGVQSMPFFRKTEISDSELEAITAYLTRNNKR